MYEKTQLNTDRLSAYVSVLRAVLSSMCVRNGDIERNCVRARTRRYPRTSAGGLPQMETEISRSRFNTIKRVIHTCSRRHRVGVCSSACNASTRPKPSVCASGERSKRPELLLLRLDLNRPSRCSRPRHCSWSPRKAADKLTVVTIAASHCPPTLCVGPVWASNRSHKKITASGFCPASTSKLTAVVRTTPRMLVRVGVP